MKSLILILLAAIGAEAQSLPDVARRERARQSQVQSRRNVTTEDIRTTAPASATPAAPATPGTAAVPAAPAARPAAPVPATRQPATAAAVDPVQKWNEDMAKQRTRLRELQTEETSLQLQLNDLTNQFTAPVSDENARRQVQTRLGETQSRLNTVRSELEQTRRSVQSMEAQGPPAARR